MDINASVMDIMNDAGIPVAKHVKRMGDEYEGKEVSESWVEKFLDADLKLHTVKCKDWSDPWDTKFDGIAISPCKVSTGEMGYMFYTSGLNHHPLGYVYRKNGKLVKHFVWITTHRDYLFRLYFGDEHIGDICNHSVEQLRKVFFDCGESVREEPRTNDIDFTKLTNGQVNEMVCLASEHDKEFRKLNGELDGKVYVPTKEGAEQAMSDQDKRDYAFANMKLSQKHNGYDVHCASIKYNEGDVPFNLPDEYKIGVEAFEQDMYKAAPTLKEAIDEIERQNKPLDLVFYSLLKDVGNIKTLIDVNLETQHYVETDCKKVWVPDTEIEVALHKKRFGGNILIFYIGGEPVAAAYGARRGWTYDLMYIQPELVHLFRVGEDTAYSRVISNMSVAKLRELDYDWKDGIKDVKGLLQSEKYLNYKNLSNDTIAAFADTDVYTTHPHSEDQGATFESIRPLCLIPDYDVELPSEYKTSAEAFEKDVAKVYPELVKLLKNMTNWSCNEEEALRRFADASYIAQNTPSLSDVNIDGIDSHVSYRDFENNPDWITALLMKGVDYKAWWDGNFPNGASSAEEVKNAIDKA